MPAETRALGYVLIYLASLAAAGVAAIGWLVLR